VVLAEHTKRFDNVDKRLDKIETDIYFVKQDVRDIKADISDTPIRSEFNKLKVKVEALTL
jgi:archaellum component FlaC